MALALGLAAACDNSDPQVSRPLLKHLRGEQGRPRRLQLPATPTNCSNQTCALRHKTKGLVLNEEPAWCSTSPAGHDNSNVQGSIDVRQNVPGTPASAACVLPLTQSYISRKRWPRRCPTPKQCATYHTLLSCTVHPPCLTVSATMGSETLPHLVKLHRALPNGSVPQHHILVPELHNSRHQGAKGSASLAQLLCIQQLERPSCAAAVCFGTSSLGDNWPLMLHFCHPLVPCSIERVPTSILSGYAGVALANVNVWFQLCATRRAASISVANLCPGTSLKLQRCATGCEHCAVAQASHGKPMPWPQPGAASLFHRARARW